MNLIEERIAYTNGNTSTIHYYWGKDLSGSFQGAGGVGGLLLDSAAGNQSLYKLNAPPNTQSVALSLSFEQVLSVVSNLTLILPKCLIARE